MDVTNTAKYVEQHESQRQVVTEQRGDTTVRRIVIRPPDGHGLRWNGSAR